MRMRREASANCRTWRAPAPTPTPAAVIVLVLLLVISSSSSPSHVADGARTTPPRRAGASGSGPGDAGVLGVDGEVVVAVPAVAAGARAGSRAAPYKPAGWAEEDEEEGSLVAVGEEEEDQLWWVKERAATGSRLPDCAHACGPCSPCRRVIVSFRCALASESCPIAYRCMCRGRFFRVPSL